MNKHKRALETAADKAIDLGWGVYNDELKADLAQMIAAYLAVMREPGPDEVRVRVCVAVDPDTAWRAAGGNDMDKEGALYHACKRLSGRAVARWIEANVLAWRPPAEETVEGEVVE